MGAQFERPAPTTIRVAVDGLLAWLIHRSPGRSPSKPHGKACRMSRTPHAGLRPRDAGDRADWPSPRVSEPRMGAFKTIGRVNFDLLLQCSVEVKQDLKRQGRETWPLRTACRKHPAHHDDDCHMVGDRVRRSRRSWSKPSSYEPSSSKPISPSPGRYDLAATIG